MTTDLTTLEIALLDDAGAIQDLSIAYGTVQRLVRPDDRSGLIDLTEAALLKLYDAGWILFFRAPRDKGYSADLELIDPLTRDEVITALEEDRDPAYIPDEESIIFFVETNAGRELFAQIPPESVPRVSGPTEHPGSE